MKILKYRYLTSLRGMVEQQTVCTVHEDLVSLPDSLNTRAST